MIHYGTVQRTEGRVIRAVMRDNTVCVGKIERGANPDVPRCFVVTANEIVGYAPRLSDAKRFAAAVAK